MEIEIHSPNQKHALDSIRIRKWLKKQLQLQERQLLFIAMPWRDCSRELMAKFAFIGDLEGPAFLVLSSTFEQLQR